MDLAAFLDAEEAAWLALHARVDALLAEIDRLSWALYRPPPAQAEAATGGNVEVLVPDTRDSDPRD